MVYTLIEQNGKTDLEIIQEDNRPNAVEGEVQGLEICVDYDPEFMRKL